MSKTWGSLVVMGMAWISDASAVTGNAFQVTSSGSSSPISIELCLSAGTSRPNSQSGCETFRVNGSALTIRTTTGGRNGQGYSNLGIKVLSSGYTVASGATLNKATGYYAFSGGSTTDASIGLSPTGFYIGQNYGGGVVACLNGGLNNLIAAEQDNNSGIEWGGQGTPTGAQSTTDGASNTKKIVEVLTTSGVTNYAAKVCADYAVDASGAPCTPGAPGCYDDWFLPASPAQSGPPVSPTSQLDCLWFNKDAIGDFADARYWSSTEYDANLAWFQNFLNGGQGIVNKDFNLRVRCVRAFNP